MYSISFEYKPGQEVYFIYKNYVKKGYIQEVSIKVDYIDHEGYCSPNIQYKVNEKWYDESKLWDNKKDAQFWLDHNLCYNKELDLTSDTAIWENIDNSNIKVKVLRLFERTNNKHPWKKMKIAEIFYFDKKGKGKFRFVPKEDIQFVNEENKFTKETKYGLMRRFGQYYVEDDIYNFVCYDGMKY